jgi:hypothetical protein
MKIRRCIYIKVYKGYFVTRLQGCTEEKKYLCSGLNHPRTLAGDWRELEKVISEIIKYYGPVYNRLIKPTVLFHFVTKQEGGYTSSELRTFQEIGRSSGANFCLMCEDKYGPLNNEQLSSIFKHADGV